MSIEEDKLMIIKIILVSIIGALLLLYGVEAT